MLKRVAFIFISLLLLLVSFGKTTFAQDEAGQGSAPSAGSSGMTAEDQKMIAPDYIIPPDGNRNLPFSGQNHFYSLVFRGNGEAIVTLRVALTNTSETDKLTDVELRIPKILDPKDLSVYQILVQGPCIHFEDRGTTFYPYSPKCLEYGEPDYYNQYFYGQAKYQKTKAEFSGDTLKVTLPTAIEPQKTGSFFVYFRAFGYARKDLFGAYNFEFESLKVEDSINQLNIGINTDADQFLKGAKGTVDYRQEDAAVALKAAPAMEGGAVANTSIDRFVAQIGQGKIVKTASNLAGLESYKVKGEYAKSRTRLYGKELTVIFVVILVLVLAVVLILRKLLKKGDTKKDSTEKSEKISDKGNTNQFLLSLGVSFASSLVSAGYTIAVFVVVNGVNNVIDYQYQAIVAILMTVISFAVYALIIIGPSIYIGVKKGVGWGLTTFGLTIVWLILFGIITVLILFIFRGDVGYPSIMPLTRSSVIEPAIDLQQK